MIRGFQFQQFFVADERSAMKVGLDGILLGAWADVNRVQRILDVGTGCGLVSLMLAQRNSIARIKGIEIDEAAATEAQQNFARSPWPERLTAANVSLQEFHAVHSSPRFDAIVCNPPYFCHRNPITTQPRALARHDVSLKLSELLSISRDLIEPTGSLQLIVPLDRFEEILELAPRNHWVLCRRTQVRPRPDRLAHRVLVRLTPSDSVHLAWMPPWESLTIANETDIYSSEFWELTRSFYLQTTRGRPDD